ncbi:hypothetical protein PC120_g22487 [Phytophthora cactorum]|nr:hypothetical protein PC120_g22487 [Phytophthora cactorum]
MEHRRVFGSDRVESLAPRSRFLSHDRGFRSPRNHYTTHLSPDDDDLEDFIPSRYAHRGLRQLFEELRDVESISKKLQTDDRTMLDARDVLDGMLGVQPTFRIYLGLGLYGAPDAPIVHLPKFDSAIVKVLSRLPAAEKTALQPFRREPPVAAPAAKQEDPSFAESILKRRKVDAVPSTYTFLAAIPPTSNVAERLFSSARAVLRHEHHRLSPMALEMILFLKEKQLILLSMLACNREPKAYISFCELNNILLQHPCIFSYLFCR